MEDMENAREPRVVIRDSLAFEPRAVYPPMTFRASEWYNEMLVLSV